MARRIDDSEYAGTNKWSEQPSVLGRCADLALGFVKAQPFSRVW